MLYSVRYDLTLRSAYIITLWIIVAGMWCDVYLYAGIRELILYIMFIVLNVVQNAIIEIAHV